MKRLRPHALALGGIVIFGFLPFMPVLVAFLIADMHGCRLDESDAHACVVLGRDIGGLLYAMSLLGWLGIATISIAAILLAPWAVWLTATLVSAVKAAKHRQ